MADAQKLEETLFSSSIRFLETEYQKNELTANVLQTFTELFCQWGEQTDKEAASLGICYLSVIKLYACPFLLEIDKRITCNN